MILRPLNLDDKEVAIQAQHELHNDDFNFLLDPKGPFDEESSWSEYLDRLESARLGRDLPEHLVPATFLVAEVDGEIVGRVSIRHELNDWLLQQGGHIGYGIRPAFRRRGYATQICAMGLDFAKSLGIPRALITCNEGNIGSEMAIKKNGGVFESTFVEESGNRISRYWISL